ncbi:L,D-transpeptidase family protein [Shewanella violacea]|uniref:L,D-TPase catalytic domain-containing protein n=1 Tax=Shewanella violacea (strain JCM 10179 / CIP 106290 / LMG 19151 / DSS12) TaxID=637905 RepID=D4ZAQ5_SHEVD|nr:L,D-transpeptidase family protein [Shewanella violacea]BAJ03100.1 conserved hypothetical protein [Shewanella violacea DSS12]
MKNLTSFTLLLILGLPIHASASEQAQVIDTAPNSQHIIETQDGIIEHIIEPMLLGRVSNVGEQAIISPYLTSHLYQQRQYLDLWQDKDYAASILEAIKGADDEGLYKEDYHYQALMSLYQTQALNDWNDPYQVAEFDILLTDAVITYATHLINGKVNPSTLEKTWNYDESIIKLDTIVAELNRHVDQRDVAQRLLSLSPQLDAYTQLKSALKKYRLLADTADFPNIKYQGLIKAGSVTPTLALIADRLIQLNYLSPQADISNYSHEFVGAVRAYQSSHSLQADGIIGKGTINSLNVPFAYRADQIRINMERARWLSSDLSQEYIIINLAGYELWMYKDGQLDWQTDIVIGKISSKTPIFKSRISYLVVNPTWTVPRSINPGLINKIKRDPSYIDKQHYMLKDSSGKKVDILAIDWQEVDPEKFKYWFVQKPWKNNALGQVKFIFPNRDAIYLHDTPTKYLFSLTDRAFSHGCIRIKNPLELAEKLLNENRPATLEKNLQIQNNKLAKRREESQLNNLSTDQVSVAPRSEPLQSPLTQPSADELLKKTFALGETQKLYLDEPMDILIMYWTAASSKGKLTFYHDVYKRDEPLMLQLKRPITPTALSAGVEMKSVIF